MSFDAETRDHRRIQRFHAMAACERRYGFPLTHGDYAMICDRVWAYLHGAGDDSVERVGRPATQRYYVRYKGFLLLVAWSNVTLQIATFLPRWSDLSDREYGLERTRQWQAAKVEAGQETTEAN